MNEILKALYERKSVRVFTEQDITGEEKETILQAALQAPSAGCQLLYTILDITDQHKKEQLALLCDNQPFIGKAKMVLVFCADCRKWLSFYREAGLDPRLPGPGDLLLAVEDALIAAQNAVTAAQSLGIGSCYIGDVMENAEKMQELLALPQYVYPACMLVFGYPTRQQQEREKPRRFALSDMVCENSYQDKSSREIREMFQDKTGEKSYEAWMEAFWKRKYESDFSREMNRSMGVYLDSFSGASTGFQA
jgi:nitroreductase